MTSAFDEGEQIRIDDIGMRGCHAVRILLVDLERAVLQKLKSRAEVPIGTMKALMPSYFAPPSYPGASPAFRGKTLSECRHRSSMAAIYTDTEASIWPNGSVRVGFPASDEGFRSGCVRRSMGRTREEGEIAV